MLWESNFVPQNKLRKITIFNEEGQWPAFMAVISDDDFLMTRQMPLNLRRSDWDEEVVIDLASADSINEAQIRQGKEQHVDSDSYYWTVGVDQHKDR